MREYIHYGSKEFDIIQFNKVKNIPLWTKPSGGLWASYIDSEYSWKQWCQDNCFRECDEKNSFKFRIDSNSNIFHIYSVKDLEKLPRVTLSNPALSYDKYLIDFEKSAKEYDAIELHLSEETDIPEGTLCGLYYALYAWDCDSILIMNPKCVIPI